MESEPGDQLEIDTNGLCLLCLKDTTATTTDNENQDRERAHHHDHDHHPAPTSIKTIMQYLSITNAYQLTNLPTSSSLLDSTMSGLLELENNAEVTVTLCESCSPLISQLSELVKEFEVIRMRIDNCMEVVRGRVAEAERNPVLKEEFERRVTQGRNDDSFDKLSGASIEDNLRVEEENTSGDLTPKESISKGTPRSLSVAAEYSPSPAMNRSQSQQEETIVSPSNSPSPSRLEPCRASSSSGSGFQSTKVVNPVKGTSKKSTSSRMRLRHTKNGTTPASRRKSRGRFGLRLTTSRQQPVVCNTCGKYFKTKQNLNNHKLIHGGVKPHHDCEYCGKTFAQRSVVTTHIVSVHTVEYLRKTLPPGWGSANESQLKKALDLILDNKRNRRNKEEFPHHLLCPCPSSFCRDKSFQKKVDLQSHIVRKHPDAIIAKIKKITGLTNRVNGTEGPSSSSAPTVGDHEHAETSAESEEVEVPPATQPQRKRAASSSEGTHDGAASPNGARSTPSRVETRPARTRKQAIPRGDSQWIKNLLRCSSGQKRNAK